MGRVSALWLIGCRETIKRKEKKKEPMRVEYLNFSRRSRQVKGSEQKQYYL